MKTSKVVSVLFFMIFFYSGETLPAQNTGSEQKAPASDTLVVQSIDIEKKLWNGEYEALGRYWDDSVKDYMTVATLKQVTSSLFAEVGSIIRIRDTSTENKNGNTYITLTTEFSKAKARFLVVFNEKLKVTGVFLTDKESETTYTLPSYADSRTYSEEAVIIKNGKWELPGTLYLPETSGKCPAVILVHGSGPNDRDETIEDNKPFRDIATGLASTGIAVLCYDKRTKVYPKECVAIQNFTVYDETIHDVTQAYSQLKSNNRIDTSRIYILGHSLGGMLIPRIAKELPDACGYIILSGPTRHLQDILLDQVTFLLSSQPDAGDAAVKQRDEIEKAVRIINSPDFPKNYNSPAILGAPVSYWMDLRLYEPAQEAADMTKPILILQGERDYQVTMEDYAGWKTFLQGKTNVVFKSYPLLNHLYLKNGKKLGPENYRNAGHVEHTVIKDISDFIKTGSVK